MFILQLVCIIVENEEDIAAFKDYRPPAEEDTLSTSATTETMATTKEDIPLQQLAVTPSPTSAPPTPPSPAPVSLSPQTAGRVFASPYARMLAAEKGINIQVVLTSRVYYTGMNAMCTCML